MKMYKGERIADVGAQVSVHEEGKRMRLLDPRHDLYNHSPNGFEWGYGGSGPGQLALALCADATGNDERALRVYQEFKWQMIAPIDGDDFSMTEGRVLEVICEIEAAQKELRDSEQAAHEDHLAEQGRSGEPGKADI